MLVLSGRIQWSLQADLPSRYRESGELVEETQRLAADVASAQEVWFYSFLAFSVVAFAGMALASWALIRLVSGITARLFSPSDKREARALLERQDSFIEYSAGVVVLLLWSVMVGTVASIGFLAPFAGPYLRNVEDPAEELELYAGAMVIPGIVLTVALVLLALLGAVQERTLEPEERKGMKEPLYRLSLLLVIYLLILHGALRIQLALTGWLAELSARLFGLPRLHDAKDQFGNALAPVMGEQAALADDWYGPFAVLKGAFFGRAWEYAGEGIDTLAALMTPGLFVFILLSVLLHHMVAYRENLLTKLAASVIVAFVGFLVLAVLSVSPFSDQILVPLVLSAVVLGIYGRAMRLHDRIEIWVSALLQRIEEQTSLSVGKLVGILAGATGFLAMLIIGWFAIPLMGVAVGAYALYQAGWFRSADTLQRLSLVGFAILFQAASIAVLVFLVMGVESVAY